MEFVVGMYLLESSKALDANCYYINL